MLTKDGRDFPVTEVTAENYIVPKGEEMMYHAKIEVVQYDPKTGKRLSRPRIQKFGRKGFESNLLDSLRKQGYTIEILHNPTEWIATRAKQVAEAREAEAKAKAQAEKEAFDKAVAEAVAKALAEQEQRKAKDKTKKEKED